MNATNVTSSFNVTEALNVTDVLNSTNLLNLADITPNVTDTETEKPKSTNIFQDIINARNRTGEEKAINVTSNATDLLNLTDEKTFTYEQPTWLTWFINGGMIIFALCCVLSIVG